MRTKLLKKLRKQFLSKYYITGYDGYYKIACTDGDKRYSYWTGLTMSAAKEKVREYVRYDCLEYVSEHRECKIRYLW